MGLHPQHLVFEGVRKRSHRLWGHATITLALASPTQQLQLSVWRPIRLDTTRSAVFRAQQLPWLPLLTLAAAGFIRGASTVASALQKDAVVPLETIPIPSCLTPKWWAWSFRAVEVALITFSLVDTRVYRAFRDFFTPYSLLISSFITNHCAIRLSFHIDHWMIDARLIVIVRLECALINDRLTCDNCFCYEYTFTIMDLYVCIQWWMMDCATRLGWWYDLQSHPYPPFILHSHSFTRFTHLSQSTVTSLLTHSYVSFHVHDSIVL